MIIWLLILIILAVFPLLSFVFEVGVFASLMPFLSILLFLVAVGVGYRVYYVSRGGEREKLMARIKELEAGRK